MVEKLGKKKQKQLRKNEGTHGRRREKGGRIKGKGRKDGGRKKGKEEESMR